MKSICLALLSRTIKPMVQDFAPQQRTVWRKLQALACGALFFVVLCPFGLFCQDQNDALNQTEKNLYGKYRITKDAINVRYDSTANSLSLGALDKDKIVEVISEKYEWFQIRLPEDFFGYIFSEYIEKIDENQGRVVASKLNLRNGPNLTAAIIGQAAKDDIVTILDTIGGWHRVKAYPYATGWVNKEFLEKIEDKNQDIALVKEILGQLSEPDMKKKEMLHRQLIQMGEGVLAPIEASLVMADNNTVYSLIYVISEIAGNNLLILADFFSKVETSAPILAAIYLDIIQNILKPEESTKPYFYLASEKKLIPAEIDDAKRKLQDLYQRKSNNQP